MKITIVGAADGEVTGSAYYVQTKGTGVLVDCGLFQGGKKSEALAKCIQQGFKLRSQLPEMGELIEL